jgi:redox-sensitive bicupin YhaK (pirin superfamily)
MINVRHAEQRGSANMGWLGSQHTFFFGHFVDPDYISYGPLRVINEDRVQPGEGFPTHGHENMEIISYVLEGALEPFSKVRWSTKIPSARRHRSSRAKSSA